MKKLISIVAITLSLIFAQNSISFAQQQTGTGKSPAADTTVVAEGEDSLLTDSLETDSTEIMMNDILAEAENTPAVIRTNASRNFLICPS